ncbi:MAG: threonine--tRNA ligase [Archangium sp.]|nr:threonine--tRNA ligase [Archangium sp.]MDP3573716.1 threonine--tRNA ligase [Archangium sp.]
MGALVTITLPDGSKKEADAGISVFDFVKNHIGPGLAKAAVFAKVNGLEADLSRAIDADASLQIFTTKAPEALEVSRHDAAHIVADAVQQLFPGTQVTIGPVIDEGFYYDFYRERDGKPAPFSPDELEAIEKRANEIVAKDVPFVRSEVLAADAVKLFESKGEKFKVEIVHDIVAKGAKTLTLYQHGEWIDFCLGPHGPSTGKVGVIKILSASGAYWRADQNREQLQRIYGISFFDKKALEAWTKQREEAAKRDHRRLGRELDLFHFHPVAPGAAFWTPKGTALYQTLSDWMRKLTREDGYVEIKTPLLFNKQLWMKSGHWDKYKENMFLVQDSDTSELDFGVKPMNCPSHHVFYGFGKHSYRELPLRLHSQDVLHRNEAAGALGGLTRVRQFAQDDGHIYAREDQIADEVSRFVKLLDRVYAAVGLKYEAKLSTRPEKKLGSDELWDRAEGALKSCLEQMKVNYELKPGDGAFYGPKIDFVVSDSIGRKWQLGTMQLDYIAAERFDLTYVGDDNKEHRPVVLHRAIYGSFERFIAILIEHFAGVFPTWLAPTQAVIVNVTDRQEPYGKKIEADLNAKGFKVEFDDRGMSMQKKIREAEMRKVPFILVIGDRDMEAGSVSPRRHGGEELKAMPIGDFAELLAKEAAIP